MRHVSPEKRTVYRHAKGGRFYASKRHEARRAKARALWWEDFEESFDDGRGSLTGTAHSPKRWRVFVARVARFLQWRDERAERP